ncbi:3-phosphoshikimate 1-carboxyvinyltransferase [Merdimmobilis hominis]|jgi:3-phosphoshikimate 1-carboxyvinyltransferase|uniref:3-phosphoshikimate 1-carboxyvinyltransferase n=1 Tax=uncultured Anaerotruncus sp. TaxID=905011 RepID=A0A6N2QXC9_9FIRM|nr:3-phosphoshikimate 1-carboxyvinyltransferase [Merdimmobilis hominis]MCD4836842.1 3-phosphoshikimate 1-carboxyvinyltransferase [Merdimmobilis hominis]PWL57917.1 MAG: 3-phosphoshikimate 1-carboxyvinyltransferase [Oscillospiraceae bacterium]
MEVTISPGRLAGKVAVPGSKSMAHRGLIAAALADGPSRIQNATPSGDIEATVRCLTALGAEIRREGEDLEVTPLHRRWRERIVLPCGESGSTLRFLLPVAAALGAPARFTGEGRLPERPLGPLGETLIRGGAELSGFQLPLELAGRLRPGEYRLPGDVSSQYVTGLLLALPLLEGDSSIRLTTPLESAGYVRMTLQVLAQFGIQVSPEEGGWRILGNQIYRAADFEVEGDYSAAALFLTANAIGSQVECLGLREDSTQGDRAILRHLETIQSLGGGRVEIDLSQCPDLAPALAVAAAYADGETALTHAGRLRLKESDRLAALSTVLTQMGAEVEEGPETLTIQGKPALDGGVTIEPFGDHRIAMAASIAALGAKAPVTIQNAQCVGKSYPQFFHHMKLLGGVCHVVNHR